MDTVLFVLYDASSATDCDPIEKMRQARDAVIMAGEEYEIIHHIGVEARYLDAIRPAGAFKEIITQYQVGINAIPIAHAHAILYAKSKAVDERERDGGRIAAIVREISIAESRCSRTTGLDCIPGGRCNRPGSEVQVDRSHILIYHGNAEARRTARIAQIRRRDSDLRQTDDAGSGSDRDRSGSIAVIEERGVGRGRPAAVKTI